MKKIIVIVVLMVMSLSLSGCKVKDEVIIKEEPIVLETQEIEIFVMENDIDIYEYTDVLLWLLLNPDDDYKFYYRDGMLYELQVSTDMVEEWLLTDVVNQVASSLTPEEIEGLTASIK